jgi:hypothetical protein
VKKIGTLPANTPHMYIFPLGYFPPIQWFSAALSLPEITLEIHAHYEKQQYTNRLWMQTSNGPLCLVVPIQRTGTRSPIKDKRISYETNWQKVHWKSIESGYRSSPYFEYYEDKIFPFYEKKSDFLLDYNLQIIEGCFSMLNIEKKISFSESYEKSDFYTQDFRKEFDPSLRIIPPHAKPYMQVFGDFVPGLSILDLICNEGPHSKNYL